MSTTSTTRATGRAIGLLVGATAALLLTGCGAAQPGIAARLGDDSVSLREIDSTAVLLCDAVEPQLKGDANQLSMRLPRAFTLSAWIERTIAEQVAAVYDVTPGAQYEASLAELERSVSAIEDKPREAYISASSAHSYRLAVLSQAARLQLHDEGLTAPTPDQVTERGDAIFATWPDSHELQIDPRFGIAFVDGQLSDIDTGLSYAVSDVAKAGAAADPEAVYIASLADSQRCG